MKTEVLKTDAKSLEKSISTAAEILRRGGTVAIPTETVYGLAASALNSDAVAKVFAAKGRPQDNPLIVHISDIDMLPSVVEQAGELAYILAERFWPGPFTMVLPKPKNICSAVLAGLDTVAVRMPDNAVCREVIRAAGLPLAAPSANVSGYPSPTTAEHVINDLFGKIDAVLAAEECKVGVESTVISLACTPPRLLRPGAVTVEQLREFIPDLVVDSAVLNELSAGQRAASPGMKYKHYSPNTEVFLVEGTSSAFAELVADKSSAVAVAFAEDEGITIPVISYGSVNDASAQAKNIFKILRTLDGLGYKAAYIHAPQKTGVGLAVYNRLIRAAGFKVIKL